jgi:hypothetical protein
MTKSRRIRWMGHVSKVGMRNAYKILVGNPEGKDYSEDGRIILKLILRKYGYLSQGRGRCRAVLNTVMNLRVPHKTENFVT